MPLSDRLTSESVHNGLSHDPETGQCAECSQPEPDEACDSVHSLSAACGGPV